MRARGATCPSRRMSPRCASGFFGPIEHNPDSVFGLRMLHGAQMAVDEANARGGYGGKPFRLMLHNDYDNWQAKAVYGDDRPTDPTIWGSASNEAVKMVYDDQDWAIFGSISSESTHIALRVALRAEIPIVNSASTDPTIPETYIPWYFTDLQDDRVQCLTLARRIFTELGLKRVAILRVNNRYGRFGVLKLRDASRRLGHPIVIEQKYMPGDTDFTHQLKVIQDSRADAIVLWADEAEAAQYPEADADAGHEAARLRRLSHAGAGPAGPGRRRRRGIRGRVPVRSHAQRSRAGSISTGASKTSFTRSRKQFASLAYDAMNALLDSICKAGLNRARIHDALADIEQYDGVTGHMVFDPNQKNVAPMYLGTVHNGAITYRVATMEKAQPAAPRQRLSAAALTASRWRLMRAWAKTAWLTPARILPMCPRASARGAVWPPGRWRCADRPMCSLRIAAGTAGHWELVPVDSDQNWGAASTQLVHALMDEHALAVVALDRNAAHLAEQLALKAFVPVLALSSDKALTSTNVPWIFRMPAETTPAAALRLLRTAATTQRPQSRTPARRSGIGQCGGWNCISAHRRA